MAYTYSGYEPHGWSQQFHPMPYYPNIQLQDEQWLMMDLTSTTHEPKSTHFEPHSDFISQRLLVPNFNQDSTLSYMYDECIRTVSPTMSHYSSSLSESSASSEHALTPNDMSQSISFVPNSATLPGYRAYSILDLPARQHTIWQPQPQNSYSMMQSQSEYPPCVPSQSSLPLSDVEMVQNNDEYNLGTTFGDHVDQVQTKSPTYVPRPQELEYPEEQDDSDVSSLTEDPNVSAPSKQSIHARTSDDGTEDEEDEDLITVDHDSDSDYDNRRAPRRSGSRITPKQKHTRKFSNNILMSQTSRIHKRSSSSATMTSTSSVSVSRGARGRSSSKSFKNKSKGPSFPSSRTSVPIPKSERIYPCTFHRFGCTSEFPNKNEWKRHVACQHLQLGYYRCDMDGCNPDMSPPNSSTSRHGRRRNAHSLARSRSSPEENVNATEEIVKYYNDFNRKDLFTQHCRRMHGPTRNPALCSKPPSKKNGQLCPTKEDEIAFETQLTDIRARCWHVRRPAPSRSSCGFCQEVFDAYYDNSSSMSTTGSNCEESEGNEEKKWEERMEHVGRHYEKEGADREEEKMDDDLVEWGLRTGVLRQLPDGTPWLVNVEDPAMEELAGDVKTKVGNSTRKARRSSKASSSDEEDTPRRKARRQPSRTAVVQRRVSFKEEEYDDTTVVVGAVKSEY